MQNQFVNSFYQFVSESNLERTVQPDFLFFIKNLAKTVVEKITEEAFTEYYEDDVYYDYKIQGTDIHLEYDDTISSIVIKINDAGDDVSIHRTIKSIVSIHFSNFITQDQQDVIDLVKAGLLPINYLLDSEVIQNIKIKSVIFYLAPYELPRWKYSTEDDVSEITLTNSDFLNCDTIEKVALVLIDKANLVRWLKYFEKDEDLLRNSILDFINKS